MAEGAKWVGTDWEGMTEGSVFCRSFQSDFTNEMDIRYLTGRAGSNGIRAYAS